VSRGAPPFCPLFILPPRWVESASIFLKRKNKRVNDLVVLKKCWLLVFSVIALFSLPVCLPHTHTLTEAYMANSVAVNLKSCCNKIDSDSARRHPPTPQTSLQPAHWASGMFDSYHVNWWKGHQSVTCASHSARLSLALVLQSEISVVLSQCSVCPRQRLQIEAGSLCVCVCVWQGSKQLWLRGRPLIGGSAVQFLPSTFVASEEKKRRYVNACLFTVQTFTRHGAVHSHFVVDPWERFSEQVSHWSWPAKLLVQKVQKVQKNHCCATVCKWGQRKGFVVQKAQMLGKAHRLVSGNLGLCRIALFKILLDQTAF